MTSEDIKYQLIIISKQRSKPLQDEDRDVTHTLHTPVERITTVSYVVIVRPTCHHRLRSVGEGRRLIVECCDISASEPVWLSGKALGW